jgi:zona occludens toxin
MLEFYSGVPGSGKTYRAVDHVYNSFLDEKNPNFGKYERFYTNINEFNFSYFNNDVNEIQKTEDQKPSFLSLIRSLQKVKSQPIKLPKAKIEKDKLIHDENDDIAIELDIDQLLIDLEEIRQLYLSKVPDSELMKRADELKLSNSLFIIDEAHNFFDTKNDTLIWWLSYHRHLHQDIMLITQSFDLIFRRYLKFSEFYYQAVPSSLRVRGGVFTYNQYIKWQLFKNSKVDSIKIKFNPDVYALYSSGANTQGKKVIYKFIFMGAGLMLFAALGFGLFKSTLVGSDDNATTKTPNSVTLKSAPTASIDRSKSFTVVCVGFDCSYLGQSISLANLNGYVKQYSLHIIESTMVSDGVFLRTFASNDKFLTEVFNVQTNITASH